ncbi:MAG: ABC transporter permease [Polyangia bacterium]
MDGFVADLRFAARLLVKAKGFTIVAVLALALGIGGTTVMYSAVDGVLMRPLPYPHAERVVRLWERWGNGGTGSISWPNLQDWRAQSRTLELLSGMVTDNLTLVRDGVGERMGAARVTQDFFALVGVQPALGRLFSADGYVHGNELLLSHEVWLRRFGGEKKVLGQNVRLSDASYVIVGVLPANFRLPGSAWGVYLPFVPDANAASRGNHFLQVMGRLAPNATLAQSRAEMDMIARALAAAYPDSNKERGVQVRVWQESLTAQLRPAIILLFGAVLLVLVIACANVANMLLARAAARQGELAVRFALGASRARVVRQLLTECLLLATLGGIAGLALALWGIDATRTVLHAGVIFEPELDGRALLFAAVVALGSTFAFGLWPALRAARGDLAAVVKDGSRSVTGARSRLRATLVVLQVALSFALLVGATLLGRSFLRVAGVEPGFDPRGVVTMQLSLPESKDPAVYFTRLLDRVQSLPDVTAAGVTDFLPLSQSNINGGFDIEGKHFDDPNRYTEYMVVSPAYFDTMRMHVVRGRGIGAGDTATAQKVCVINQDMARRWFGGDDPIGKHMRLEWNDDDKSWLTVVGIVADSRRFGLDGEPTPETYLPFAQQPYRRMALAVRGRGSAGDLGALVRREVASVDPTEATFDVTTMAETVDESLRPRKMLLDFTSFFGAVALALAAIGLYGVLAVQVAQRTRELGIRMALGARPSDVRGLVVQQAVTLAVLGAGVGAVTALGLSSVLSKLLYGVGATDPPTYVAVAVTLVGVAGAAAWLPSRRATAIDPMIALRA